MKGKVSEMVVNVLFWICILFVGWIVLNVLGYSSFKIPSNSMEPALVTGDRIWVAKPVLGARIFNPFAPLHKKDITIRRLPGWRKAKRNDVLVFNFPYRSAWDTVCMDLGTYYVKRCIGVPGDTVEISEGFYVINGQKGTVGNQSAQKALSLKSQEEFEPEVYNTFPYHPAYPWNIRHFGPLVVPGEGICVPLSPENLCLYKRWIEWETGKEVICRNQEVYIGEEPTDRYCFRRDYYFVGGDRVEDSKDSRYWGFLPEVCIVGKAWIIWKSEEEGRTWKLIK
ncbi:signal peptidase I [Odoribacter lunatus]|uniref:signal peptidase I n=1 Tax=Odoribacter lunatus TaxID=2941335 RepID=UPI00203B8E98|nr:signal peptidase I [Odoribacter lunatus]